MYKQNILHVIGSDVQPQYEEEFNQWYDEIHVPLVLKSSSQIMEARRYKLANFQICKPDDTPPKYICLYVFKNQLSWDKWEVGPDRASLLEIKMKEGNYDIKWRLQYQELKQWINGNIA